MIFKKEFKKINNNLKPSDTLNANIKEKMQEERLDKVNYSNKKLVLSSMIILSVLVLIIVFNYNNISFNNKDDNKKTCQPSNNINDSRVINDNLPNRITDCSPCYDYSDSKVIYELSDYIAIIKVNSIDSVTNSIEQLGVNTNGTATIIGMLKGNIKDKKIAFKRSGGILSYQDYINGEHPKEGIIPPNDPENLMVDARYRGDIDIKEGRVYLAYISKLDGYKDKNLNGYYIMYHQYGLREIQDMCSEITIKDIKDLKVRNNDTDKWESIKDVIPNI